MYRIKEAHKSSLKIVDVDGSYLYRKYRRLLSEGNSVSPPGFPSIPLSGWEQVNEDNHATLAKKIPWYVLAFHCLFCCVTLFVELFFRAALHLLSWKYLGEEEHFVLFTGALTTG